LLSSNLVSPTISLANEKSDGAGINHIHGQNVILTLDARDVSGATSFEVEVGKVNYFFNNFEKVTTSSPVEFTVRSALNAPQVKIAASNFARPGFYELRARCLDAAGKPIGEYSDNLTLKASPTSTSVTSK